MLPRFWIILLLVLAAGSATAQSGDGDVLPGPTAIPQVAPISAEWHGSTLIVQSDPGCLYLVGGGRITQLAGCDQSPYTLASFGDPDYAPMGRTLVLVRDHRSVARLVVPLPVVLSASWQGDVLHVIVTQPGCLYLSGGGRPVQWLGCDEPTYLLPSGGVDQAYNPVGRELVLRNELAQTTTARLLVPSRDFRVILVLVVKG